MSDEVRNSRSYTPRRAIMYVPGNDERKLSKIPTLDVDCVVLDCEDGVAFNKKAQARETIRNVLDGKVPLDFGRSECTVRVNSVDSGSCDEDLKRILNANQLPASIHLPKVDYVDQLEWFVDTTNQILDKREDLQSKINLIMFIESAQAMLALPELCKHAWLLSTKSHFVPDALVFGSDDYCASIGATRTKDGKELLYARQYLVMVAKAFKLQAIDMVHIDYKDVEGLKVDALAGLEMGFTGKQVIHPGQIQPCQAAFTPTDDKIQWARELIEAFGQEQGSGKGAFAFRGQMIDKPSLLQAKNIVELAAVCGK